MADLRIENTTLAEAQATFRTASDRLGPVAWTLKGLNADAVGAAALAAELQDAGELLAAEFGIIGQALAELAAHAVAINATFTQVDQGLSLRTGGVR